MNNEYRIEPYAPQHRPAMVALLGQLLLHRSSATLDRYLTWKYDENPWIRQPMMSLVFSGAELVAMRALVGTRWIDSAGESVTLPAAEDLVIDAAHRDRGLFLLIDRDLRRIARDAGFRSMVSLSAHNEDTQNLQRVTGWEHTWTVETLVRPPTQPPGAITSSDLVRRVVGKAAQLTRQRASAMGLLTPQRWPSAVTFTAQPDAEAMAALADRPSGSGWQPIRTAAWYRWRLGNPDRRYAVMEWRETDLRGFLILSRQPPPNHEVRIVHSGAESPEILRELIRAVISSPKPALAMAAHRVPDDPSLGFADKPEELVKVFARPLQRGEPPVALARIDLLDSMLV